MQKIREIAAFLPFHDKAEEFYGEATNSSAVAAAAHKFLMTFKPLGPCRCLSAARDSKKRHDKFVGAVLAGQSQRAGLTFESLSGVSIFVRREFRDMK